MRISALAVASGRLDDGAWRLAAVQHADVELNGAQEEAPRIIVNLGARDDGYVASSAD